VWLLLLLLGCADIPRDNLLDPANESGYTEPVVLIEAFVNTAPENPYIQYSQWALDGIGTLEDLYGDRIVIAEYHRDVAGYDDKENTDLTSQKFTQIQDRYIDATDPVPRGIPDVFLNGKVHRISGAANSASISDEAAPVLDKIISEKNYYLIQPLITIDETSLGISCRVAALGNRSATNLKMRLIFIKESDQAYLRHLALDVSDLKPIDDLKKGQYVEVSFEALPKDQNVDYIIFALLDANGENVLQAVKEVL